MPVRIRTITMGVPGDPESWSIPAVAEQLRCVEDAFASSGYEVQTIRVALPHWDSWAPRLDRPRRLEVLRRLNEELSASGIDYCSVGLLRDPADIDAVADLLVDAGRLSASVDMAGPSGRPYAASIRSAAAAVVRLSQASATGADNFRFGACCCVEPGQPYFPGAYHAGRERSFSIGLENSELLGEALGAANGIDGIAAPLLALFSRHYIDIQQRAMEVASQLGVRFGGIDTSVAPSIAPHESVVRALEMAGIQFGGPGTVAACGAVTSVLKAIPVQRVGYCGLMLPVLEDPGVADAASRRAIGVSDLLLYSSVSGVGVDMVPVPGDVGAGRLEALMLDVATVALKLRKPLVARLLPIPGKHPGDRTDFDTAFLCNAAVMAL